MSWVAELNAMSQKKANVARKKKGAGNVSATPAIAAPTRNCMATIHQRRVRKISTKGLHNGLMTQGR